MTQVLSAQEQQATLRVVDALCSLFESLSIDFLGEFKWECHKLCEALVHDPRFLIPERDELLAVLQDLRAHVSTHTPGHVSGYPQRNKLIFLSIRLRQKLVPLDA
ncbi:MAG: hypothetical protein EON92_02535 [Burkholderiales bacterium]|nr:MAG: hypothetical protein EON92_02535 [Burkholderiales bacterium]